MNNRNSLLALVCALVFVLASCLAPVGIEPGGKVRSERYETIDLQTSVMEYKVKTPAQWQIIMRLINIKSANALRAAQAAESEENVPQAASSADTQTIAPVYTMILGAGANITLPSSGAELNPPLTTEGVTLIVKGEDSANPSTLTLGGDGTLLDIGANRTLILENVIVQGKAGNTGGPLIKVQGGALELKDGTLVTGNENTGVTGGGGIFLDGGSLLAGQGTKITGNSASGGGGIYAQSNASLTIEGVIGGGLPGEGNNAGGDGGGIYLSGGAVIALEDGSEIVGNTAGNGGGGIYFNGGTHEIGAGVKISGNSASGTNGKGGGVYANNAVLTLEGVIGGTSQSEGNTAKIQGGGIYLSGGSLTLEDGAALSWNSVTTTVLDYTYGGGGVFANGTAVTMNGASVISDNSGGGNGWGGGIHLENNGSLTMNGNSAISRNGAGYGGGGVFCYGSVKCTVTMWGNSVIGGFQQSDGNTAKQGGGISIRGGLHSFEMRDNAAINYNTAYSPPPLSGAGGGIAIFYSNNNTVIGTMYDNSVIRNNTASGSSNDYGGGVYLSGGGFMMKDNSKIGGANTAMKGGGVFIAGMYGGALYMEGSAMISGNYANSQGGGVAIHGGGTFGGGNVTGNTKGSGTSSNTEWL